MIDINFDDVTTNIDLADRLDQQFEIQTTTFFSSLEGTYSGMVIDAGMNCGIMSSVKSMAKSAAGQFLADVREFASGVESAIADITKGVGDIIKNVRSAVDSAIAKMQEFADWVREKVDDVISEAVAAINNVIDTINGVIDSAMQAVNEVLDAIKDLASEMVSSLKNISLRICNSMSLSLADIGIGAGIDNIVDAVTAPIEDFTEKNMGGMKDKLNSYKSSLSSLSGNLKPGASEANAINGSFDPINDLIASLT